MIHGSIEELTNMKEVMPLYIHNLISPSIANPYPRQMYDAGGDVTPPHPLCDTPNDTPPRAEAVAPKFTVKVSLSNIY